MIVTKTPFRVTLGGGGTDLPSYYNENGGFIFSMGITQYMYVFLNKSNLDNMIRLHYTKSEEVENISELKHELAREALKLHKTDSAIEISSLADIPAGTGVGSSSSYLVGLLNAIRNFKGESTIPKLLAEEACKIELDILKKGIGKQDQYMAAYGGLTVLNIHKNGKVNVEQLELKENEKAEFVSKNHIYYTGFRREAEKILYEQNQSMLSKNNTTDKQIKKQSLDEIKSIGKDILEFFKERDFEKIGNLFDKHWINKIKLSKKISNSEIDSLYEYVKKNFNVRGGKIIGAGGGGFILLYCDKEGHLLDEFMIKNGYMRLNYQISDFGSQVIINTES